MSTNIGLAPIASMKFVLATNVNDGTKISSPFLMSAAIRAACNADVQLLHLLLLRTCIIQFQNLVLPSPPSLAADVRTLSSKTCIISLFSSASNQGLFTGIIF
jgi:hypothetical protein